jgi:hypothetical protein
MAVADLSINIQQEANEVCTLIDETKVVKYEIEDMIKYQMFLKLLIVA